MSDHMHQIQIKDLEEKLTREMVQKQFHHHQSALKNTMIQVNYLLHNSQS